MANGVNAPFGLKPTRLIDGSPWNGGVGKYTIASAYATSLFVGDPVTLLNDGTIGIGVAGSPVIGVFMGASYYKTAGGAVFPGGLGGFGANYWPGGTTLATGTVCEVQVADNPNLLFEIQSNTSAGVTTAGLNLNYNFVSGTGNTANGLSAYALNIASGQTTVDLNLKALRFPQYPGNLSGVGYNIVEVSINNHILKGGSGTSGV